MSAKQSSKIQTLPILAHAHLSVGTAVIGRVCSVTKNGTPLHTQLLLLLVLVVCDDPQQQSQNTGVCFVVVQLNNKQSINLITSLCWSYFSRRNYFRVIHIIPFLQNQAFLAALRVTGSASLSPNRQDRQATTLHCHYHYHYHYLPRVRAETTAQRQQQGQHDTGSSGMCLQYFT
jgi:hypothetical protein